MGRVKIRGYIIVAVLAVVAAKGFSSAFSASSAIPQTFEELIQLSDEEIENIDVARINLLCAKGLPGSENLDIEQCLSVLDDWARHVKAKERKYAPYFHRFREKYSNSLPLYKGVYLGLAIQQDFKCGYNEALLDSGVMADHSSTAFFRDSSDIFINGLTLEQKGSCSSLPVLMVALGRRCDYPMYLVACGGHLFARWDDGTEVKNFEVTGEGINSHSNEYYRTWPREISDEEIKSEHLMRNLTNKEMLGVFASLRAVCFQEHERYEEALFCEKVAQRIFPESRITNLRIRHLEKLMERDS